MEWISFPFNFYIHLFAISIYAQSLASRHINARISAQTHKQHRCSHEYTNSRTSAHMYTQRRLNTKTCLRPSTNIYIQKYTYTDTNTYKRKMTHLFSLPFLFYISIHSFLCISTMKSQTFPIDFILLFRQNSKKTRQ